jgi:hypothetical protein
LAELSAELVLCLGVEAVVSSAGFNHLPILQYSQYIQYIKIYRLRNIPCMLIGKYIKLANSKQRQTHHILQEQEHILRIRKY